METAMLTAGFKTFNPQNFMSVIGSTVFRRMVTINEALTSDTDETDSISSDETKLVAVINSFFKDIPLNSDQNPPS